MFVVAVQGLKLQPREFWRLTWAEFEALTDDQVSRTRGGLSGPELQELDHIGREAMAKEALERGVPHGA